ncbi:MAG: hypothetical protein M1118_01875, partial [Chloroflexi bacterium]|nr:hypothetical protein [Chloroflexota bacterium]
MTTVVTQRTMTALVKKLVPTPHSEPSVAGNARLTAMTALVLFVLLGLEGVTILAIRHLLSWHFFFGFML